MKEVVKMYRTYCFPEFEEYLLENWYSKTRFHLWGRENWDDGIPFAKTTMMIEAYWSVLKRHELSKFNRPRCDLLLFLLDETVLPRIIKDFHQLINGRVKPSWWKRFTSM